MKGSRALRGYGYTNTKLGHRDTIDHHRVNYRNPRPLSSSPLPYTNRHHRRHRETHREHYVGGRTLPLSNGIVYHRGGIKGALDAHRDTYRDTYRYIEIHRDT